MKHHIIISGTGRAGTTFLVQILSKIGMDTGFSDNYLNVHENCNAGLEKDIFEENSPYIIKNPWLCDYIDKVLENKEIIIDHAIIPMRDLFEAAESRRDVTRRSSDAGIIDVPGGLWHTDNPENQENILLNQFYKLIYHLVKHDIPITMLEFPKFANDQDYFYNKMKNVFPDLDKKSFVEAFEQIADTSKVHKFK